MKARLSLTLVVAATLLAGCGDGIDELLGDEALDGELESVYGPCVDEKLFEDDDDRYLRMARGELRAAKVERDGEIRPLIRKSGEREVDEFLEESLAEEYAALLAAEDCAKR
jgi:hypothetical protein